MRATMWICRIALAVLLIVVIRDTFAHHDPRHEAVHQKMNVIMEWLAKNTDYKHTKPPPVIFVPKNALDYIYVTAEGQAYNGQETQVMALYVNHLMIVSDTWLAGRDDYIIAHELVHHLQWVNNKRFACMSEMEFEAYTIQTKFAKEFGGRMPNDLFMMVLRNGCQLM